MKLHEKNFKTKKTAESINKSLTLSLLSSAVECIVSHENSAFELIALLDTFNTIKQAMIELNVAKHTYYYSKQDFVFTLDCGNLTLSTEIRERAY